MSGKRRQELRSEMRLVLSRLDKRWLQAASKEICNHLTLFLEGQHGKNVTHILAWAGFHEGEVDISSFIGEQLGKRQIFLPRMGQDRTMQFIQVNDILSQVVEPSPSEVVYSPQHAKNTLVLVPGLAFDKSGNRLGRGLGYYSRFVRPPMHKALKIGVCWELQLLSEIPAEADHVVMDWICQERSMMRISLDEEDL